MPAICEGLVLPEIGSAGQDCLRRSRVLLVGVGGLGIPVAQYLAAANVDNYAARAAGVSCDDDALFVWRG